jgi:hypothetical protein
MYSCGTLTSAVLCCAVLCCTVLCCAVLYGVRPVELLLTCLRVVWCGVVWCGQPRQFGAVMGLQDPHPIRVSALLFLARSRVERQPIRIGSEEALIGRAVAVAVCLGSPTPEPNGEPGDPCAELDMKREARTHGGTFGQYYNESDWKKRDKQRKELIEKQTKLETRVRRSTRSGLLHTTALPVSFLCAGVLTCLLPAACCTEGHWAGTEYYIDSLQGSKLAAARKFTQVSEPDHSQLEAQTERLYPYVALHSPASVFVFID